MKPCLIFKIKTRFRTLLVVNSEPNPMCYSRVLPGNFDTGESVWSYIFKLDQIE